MTENYEDKIRGSIIEGGSYEPIEVEQKYLGVTYIAGLDKRSRACNIIRRQKENNKPQFIIIHGTTPGIQVKPKLSSFHTYMVGISLPEETKWRINNVSQTFSGNKGGSGHYTVFQNGNIAQHASETHQVIQCESYNHKSIGIEHHFIFGREPPTEQMYKASADLVKDILKRYNMLNGRELKDVVFPHDPSYDPGPYWDWDYYFKLIKEEQEPGTPRTKQQTDANRGTDKMVSVPNPSIGPRKRFEPSHSLPFYSNNNEEDNIAIEEIENGILPFFLKEILKQKEEIHKQDPLKKVKKIFYEFNSGKATPFLPNFIFGKEIVDYKKHNSLTNAELSNFVPFVELYLIKNDGDYMYPFDDYTSRAKIENIFINKTSRGGAVGIKSVTWKSLATNQSNLAQQSVKISLLIQDIQEIEEERNGVSLLDFLYPAGSRDPFEYNRNNFNIKMKVGWKYKNNFLTSNVGDKISKDMIEETMFLSLFKHSFEFNEKDGTVLLSLEYIGMLEAELDDKINSDVLPNLLFETKETIADADIETQKWKNTRDSFLRWDKKSQLPKDDNLYHYTKKDGNIFKYIIIEGGKFIGDATWEFNTNSPLNDQQIKEIIDVFNNKTKDKDKEKDANEKLDISYSALIKEIFLSREIVAQNIDREEAMNYLYLSEADVDTLKLFARVVPDSSDYENVLNIQKKAVKELSLRAQNPDTIDEAASSLREIETQLNYDSGQYIGGGDEVNQTKMLAAMRQGAQNFLKTEGSKNDIFIPYTFLGNILRVFYNKLGKDKNENFRIAFSHISYNSIFESENTAQNEQGGTTTTAQNTIQSESGTTRTLVPEKLYFNILDIPITFKSFDSWYRTNVIDTQIKAMSFNEFVKKIIFELVPQNINPKVLPWTPEIDFTPNAMFETFYSNKMPDTLIYKEEDFLTPEKIKGNQFYKFYKKREKQNDGDQKYNILFIFSKNEIGSHLKGDPGEDASRNISHLYVGEENGLVKQIKFSREDNKQLDAANIVLANKSQAKPGIIRQIYQLKLDMFGNTMFTPGTLLHISPTFPGSRLPNTTLYKIGLGGYYMTTEVNSTIEDNQFTTSIVGKWQTSGIDGPESLKNKTIEIEEVFDESQEEEQKEISQETMQKIANMNSLYGRQK